MNRTERLLSLGLTVNGKKRLLKALFVVESGTGVTASIQAGPRFHSLLGDTGSLHVCDGQCRLWLRALHTSAEWRRAPEPTGVLGVCWVGSG